MINGIDELSYKVLFNANEHTVVGIFRDEESYRRFEGHEPWNYPAKNSNVFGEILRKRKIKLIGNYKGILAPAIFFNSVFLFEEDFKHRVEGIMKELQFDPREIRIFCYQIL